MSHLAPVKPTTGMAGNLRARIVALKKSFTDLREQKVDICSVCHQRDIPTKLAKYVEALMSEVVETLNLEVEETLFDLVNRQPCGFCRLILHLLSFRNAQQMIHWASQQSDGLLRRHEYKYYLTLASDDNLGTISVDYKSPEHEDYIHVGCIYLSSGYFGIASRFRINHVPRETKIDHHTLLKYVKDCEKTHPRCKARIQEAKSQAAIEIYLIDVKNNRIVKGRSDLVYVALSYVWGGTEIFKSTMNNVEILMQHNGLLKYEQNIPQLIKDAIQFTKNIGIRYIWIDALCIVQDDVSSKHQQIRQMDIIYSHATLTLVTIHAVNTLSSIHGVRTGTRSQPRAIELVDGVKLVTVPNSELTDFTKISVHTSRGWTFQEQVLSTRCLHLGEKQAFFQCLTTIQSEISEEDRVAFSNLYALNPLAGEAMYSDPDPLGVYPDWYPCIELYQFSVKRYLGRQLTYESDILPAFAGMISLLQNRHAGPFYHGLPGKFFDIALLWSSARTCERRRAPPDQKNENYTSWSWTGWKGGLNCFLWETYNYRATTPHLCPLLQSKISNFYFFDGTAISKIHREPFLLLQLPEEDTTEKFPLENIRLPVGSDLMNSIIFHANCTPINPFISKTTTQESDNILKLEFGSKRCGVILMSIAIDFISNTRDSFDLVLLARMERDDNGGWLNAVQDWWTEGEPNVRDGYNNRLTVGLVVFLVRWQGKSAERIGVGHIREEAWASCSPVRKLICLT
jgi:hypothetical protein